MHQFIVFLHVLGSISVGFYLLLPFLASRLAGLRSEALAGYTRGMYVMNRVGQWLLIVQFLTGGYLISDANVSTAWIIAVIVLFVILGAMSGMIGGPLRRIMKAGEEGSAAAAKDVSKARTFSAIAAVMVLLETILMVYRYMI